MITAYVSARSPDVWIEVGVAPWPQIQREARRMLDEIAEPAPWVVMRYEGIVERARVSDVEEEPHSEDQEADGDPDLIEEYGLCDGCCRTIRAHHFRGVLV